MPYSGVGPRRRAAIAERRTGRTTGVTPGRFYGLPAGLHFLGFSNARFSAGARTADAPGALAPAGDQATGLPPGRLSAKPTSSQGPPRAVILLAGTPRSTHLVRLASAHGASRALHAACAQPSPGRQAYCRLPLRACSPHGPRRRPAAARRRTASQPSTLVPSAAPRARQAAPRTHTRLAPPPPAASPSSTPPSPHPNPPSCPQITMSAELPPLPIGKKIRIQPDGICWFCKQPGDDTSWNRLGVLTRTHTPCAE